MGGWSHGVWVQGDFGIPLSVFNSTDIQQHVFSVRLLSQQNLFMGSGSPQAGAGSDNAVYGSSQA